MNTPLISVIVPVYNTKPYLEQCLDSLTRQEIRDMEVIMVNDGSTDGSAEVLKQTAKQDRRFRYSEQTNQGLSVARNTGLAQAKGKYIAFLDSDDWLEDGSLSRLCLHADTMHADITVGNTVSVFADGHTWQWGGSTCKLFENGRVMSGTDFFVEVNKMECYVPMVYNYVYRRDFLEENAFRFMFGLIHEDELWTPLVMVAARRVAYSDICHYNYRQRENSIMNSTAFVRRLDSLMVITGELLEAAHCQPDHRAKKALCRKARFLYGLVCRQTCGQAGQENYFNYLQETYL